MSNTIRVSRVHRDVFCIPNQIAGRKGDSRWLKVYIYETQEDWDLTYPVESSVLRTTTLGRIKRTALFQNFPNPFNAETWLPYHLATDAEVAFRIYNIQGQLVRQLDLGRFLNPATAGLCEFSWI